MTIPGALEGLLRLWAISGGPGRVLEAFARRVFNRVAPRGSQRAILQDLGSILGGLGLDFERIWG